MLMLTMDLQQRHTQISIGKTIILQGILWDSWSYSWVNASIFANYLKENPAATLIARYSARTDDSYPTPPNNVSTTAVGDVLMYDLDSNGKSDHAAILVSTYGKDESTAPSNGQYGDLQDQHTKDYYHVIWNLNYYSDYKTMTITVLRPN